MASVRSYMNVRWLIIKTKSYSFGSTHWFTKYFSITISFDPTTSDRDGIFA